MLHRVPEGMRVAARAMVTRHQNSIDAQVYRRKVLRTEGAESGDAGGLPTLGGLAVLEKDDEPEFEFVLLGNCKVLFVTNYEPTEMTDNHDSPESMATGMALIEPDTPNSFEPGLKDLVMLMPGGGVVIPYEITNMLAQVNIPPYITKYELSQQGDMEFTAAVAASQAART